MTSTLVDQIRPFLRIEDEAFDDPRRSGASLEDAHFLWTRVAFEDRRLPLITALRSSWERLDWGETERAALALSARKVAQANGPCTERFSIRWTPIPSYFEQLYVSGRWSGFRWVVGHYEIGRRTFDLRYDWQNETDWLGIFEKSCATRRRPILLS